MALTLNEQDPRRRFSRKSTQRQTQINQAKRSRLGRPPPGTAA
ncbi:MAG: hypothetical protein [Olavius algarvensis Gamma 1 endosymbiont]|nr:MAG: hypothetical protein [Olavius algarvensis Gamma 1 endosymbiont]